MTTLEPLHRIEGTPLPRVHDADPVVIAIVGYRNAGDIRTCLSALAQLTEKNFIVSICENGGLQSYQALVEALGGLVDIRRRPAAAP